MDRISILKLEGIMEKNSYERRIYESVDDRSLYSYLENRRKKEFEHLRVNPKSPVAFHVTVRDVRFFVPNMLPLAECWALTWFIW